VSLQPVNGSVCTFAVDVCDVVRFDGEWRRQLRTKSIAYRPSRYLRVFSLRLDLAKVNAVDSARLSSTFVKYCKYLDDEIAGFCSFIIIIIIIIKSERHDNIIV